MTEQSPEMIKYASILKTAKIVTYLYVVCSVPFVFMVFGGRDILFGIHELVFQGLFAVGSLIYAIFFLFFWKCPKCKRFPGGGWVRLKCKNCWVKLQ